MAVAARGPKTPELLWHAGSLLREKALALFDGAPESREVMLMRAALLRSDALAETIRQKWPEWRPAI